MIWNHFNETSTVFSLSDWDETKLTIREIFDISFLISICLRQNGRRRRLLPFRRNRSHRLEAVWAPPSSLTDEKRSATPPADHSTCLQQDLLWEANGKIYRWGQSKEEQVFRFWQTESVPPLLRFPTFLRISTARETNFERFVAFQAPHVSCEVRQHRDLEKNKLKAEERISFKARKAVGHQSQPAVIGFVDRQDSYLIRLKLNVLWSWNVKRLASEYQLVQLASLARFFDKIWNKSKKNVDYMTPHCS